jgi:uncharacterized protein (DUF1697 family)
MKPYVLLLRGVNVGGKNKVSMAALRECLQKLGFANVATYIASGNVIVDSDKTPAEIGPIVEKALTANFALDSELIKVLVLSREQLRAVVANKPQGFGDKLDLYHSDAIFLINIDAKQAMPVFDPREGVDAVWPGEGVVYSQRLSAERTKSRLGKIIGTPVYKTMTIRSWNTTVKLLEMIEAR